MIALKNYPVVWKDGEVVFKPTAEFSGTVYPGVGTEYKEFATYAEAEAFIKEKGLKEPHNH